MDSDQASLRRHRCVVFSASNRDLRSITSWPRTGFPGWITQSRMPSASARCSKRFCLDDRRLRHHSAYLVLVGNQDILPLLFGRVIVPEAVMRELQAAAAPPGVRQWLSNRPAWLETKQAATPPDTTLSHLDEGER